MILSGYVISLLWLWFIVPTFGLLPISIPTAIGISIITYYVTYQHIDIIHPKRTGKDTAKDILLLLIARPLIALFTGWIVKLFM